MSVFGLYPENKYATVKIFEKRVKTCYSCEFCQTVKSPFKDVYFEHCCTKGLQYQENFDVLDYAKYENKKCPINKW
jgi:hypothetical protein